MHHRSSAHESDLSTLSKVLAASERRAAVLERENTALRNEIREIDPSGGYERRALEKLPSFSGSFDERSLSLSERGERERGSSIPPIFGMGDAISRDQFHSDPKKIDSSRLGSRPSSSRPSSARPQLNAVKSAAALRATKGKTNMVSLQAGDLIWLRQKDDTRRGTVLGECSLKAVGVQPDDAGTTEYVPPLRFDDGVFRLCSHFNYRSKVEVSKILKASLQSGNPEATQRELNLPLAKKRMASEAVQNAELLQRLIRSSPHDANEPIRYGDVVQLQHVNSGLFLAMHKTPALQNPTCRKVSLKAGSLAAHFKILPKYKVRSIGSLAYADDEIVLQSVKHESLYLGASDPTPTPGLQERALRRSGGSTSTSMRQSSLGSVVIPDTDIKLRVPAVLRRDANSEVNGSMELRSFTIKIYRRNERQGSLLTSLHWFRLFHPEANGFVQASCNPDKGQVLDALGTPDDPFEASRLEGVPAHVPYLKTLASSADASNPINLSTKAMWSFEPLDRTRCVEVQWRTMALRIRHVPSGKYLSVNSSRATPITPQVSAVAGGAISPVAEVEDEGEGIVEEGHEGVAMFFDTALVEDEDPSLEEGDFGSPSSMIFYLMPTDVTGATLREGTSAIRVEHRSKGTAGKRRVLYLVTLVESKPPMLASTSGSGVVRVAAGGTAGGGKGFGGVGMKKAGVRLCFTSEFSALHVLKVQPVGPGERFKLNKLLSYVRLLKRYSYLYHATAGPNSQGTPLHLCIPVASQCLDLIDDLRKGVPPPRRHGTNMTEALKEANSLKPAAFSLLFGGEQEPRMQKAACEVKLLDALFEAALAPYNFAQQATGESRPFATFPHSMQPRAVQKFVYVAIQRVVFGNLLAQNYFSLRSSRTWLRQEIPLRGSNGLTSVVDVEKMDSLEEGEAVAPKSEKRGEVRTRPKKKVKAKMALRKWELWRNSIVAQGEDSLGATVTLGQLLKSSANIVKKLVNNELIERFQRLLVQVGPEVRLMNLFASICYVEKRPSRANQEMCVRKLWMSAQDRYSFGVTFHEVDVPEKELPRLGTILKPDGSPSPWPRERAPKSAPAAYLGREPGNRFKQVCVAWTGTDEWQGGCGHLWFSPASMALGPVVETRHVEGVEHPVRLVPLEQLMWVVEPERLSLACTGRRWTPFARKKRTLDRKQTRSGLKEPNSEINESLRRKRFENQLQLATYIISQLELLTQMCKGRSYNCIAWLEQSFSFGLLMNIATNPHLPYKLIATVIDFMQALYVDRFPQFKNSGAPILPEKLWVYHESADAIEGPRRSSTPVVQKLDLKHDAAFPVFALSPLCSAYNHPEPVLSHTDHFKFFLLRSHCNSIIKSFGNAGRIIHDSQSLNEFGMAAISGQQNLLKFGFQSTHAKLVDLCVPNGALLDGRSDLLTAGKIFDPPTARYRDTGSASQVVTKLKREMIETFFDIGDLRTNFRLGQILYKFKEKVSTWASKEESGGSGTSPAKDYIMQSTPTAVDELYADFEAMFPGGSGDGAKLDIAVLACKPDMDQALIDCMMYDDDNLMSAALRLLESNYGQRRQLRTSLAEVTLLEHVRIPVYGDVHALRADLSELVFLTRTSTVWGVKSRVAGPFGDEQFGTIMHIINKVIVFVHTPYTQDRLLMGSRGESSSYGGHFAETDLHGYFYESKDLWSFDVADEWAPKLRDNSHKIDKHNQDILRSSNLQEILRESVMMDTDIAWKGSICTDREKAESERRLIMVKRALLVCCTVFAKDNSKNQVLMFECLSKLEELATPPKLVDQTETDGNFGLDSRMGRITSEPEQFTAKSDDLGWPASLTQLAQNVIIVVLKGNPLLCASVSPTLVSLFSHIANLHVDVSSAPVLDMLFILCKPGAAPVLDIQQLVCSNLTAFERGQGLENVFESLCACLEACAFKSMPLPDFSKDLILLDDSTNEKSTPVTSAAGFEDGLTPIDLASNGWKIEVPERLVRLMRVVCEGGNEAAAAQLEQSCGISIDAVCIAIVNHLECCQERAVHERTFSAVAPVDGSSDYVLLPKTVLHIMSKRNGVGKSLLGLLVELVFLLPLNHDQIGSIHLWEFLEKCAVPLMEALGKSLCMEKNVLEVCTDIVDLIEHVFTFVVRLGLFRAVTENPIREQIIADIAEDLQLVLDRKQKTPQFLKDAFVKHCEYSKTNALDKAQFVDLTIKLMREGIDQEEKRRSVSRRVSTVSEESRTLSHLERDELEHAFDDADQDGNGEVDVYEFVETFSNVSVGRKFLKSGMQVGKNYASLLNMHGHRLGLRTVECAERILVIRKGKGGELALPHYTRQDDYGMRRKGGEKGKSNGPNKLFVRPTTAQFGSTDSTSQSSSLVSKKHAELSLQEKFKLFQASVRSNPRILRALQKRRFTMVSILEKGTPGPPPGAVAAAQALLPLALTRAMSFKRLSRLSMKVAPTENIREEMAKRKEKNKDLSFVFDKAEDASARKIQAAFRKYASTEASSYYVESSETSVPVLLQSELDNSMSGAVALTWEDVTLRFVRYVTDHFWPTKANDTCTLVFETWNAHLIKARTWALDEEGRKLPMSDMPKAATIQLCTPHDLNEFELSSFHWKQSELNRMGVTQLLAMVVSSLSHDLNEGSLPDTAIELFNELLNGGNEHVQDTLYTHLVTVDTEGKLVEHMAKRLEKSFEGLVEAKKNGRLGSDDDDKTADIAEDCEHIITTTRFMQLLCEGHHADFQNYLRCQPMYGGDVDLIKSVCNMVVFFCESSFVVSKFTFIELDLVAQLLNMLIDAQLGPCAGNQDLIAKSDVVASLNLVIHATNTRDANLANKDPRHMGIRGLSCVLLAACLEGREDHATHEHLERKLETQMLEHYRAELEVDIWAILSKAKSQARLPRPDEVQRIEVMQQFLVAVSTVLTELDKKLKNNVFGGLDVALDNRDGGSEVVQLGRSGQASSAFGNLSAGELKVRRNRMAIAMEQLKGAKKEPLVGLVEIAWQGRVERTVFPLPFEIKYLSSATKKDFLDEVDLSTSEKRMKGLLKKTDCFVREMEIIYREAEQSKVYRVLHKHLPMVKLANYGLVFALNLNILLSPASLGAPARSVMEDLNGTNPLKFNERLSLFFTLLMGVLCTIGYLLIISNLSVTEVPLLIQELDDRIREDTEEAVAAMNEQLEAAASHGAVGVVGVSATALRSNGSRMPLLANEGGPPVKRDPNAWLPLTYGLLFTVLFSMLHIFNFPVNYGMYIGMVSFAAVPLTFSGLRNYIGSRPASQRERAYAIVYDCIVRRSFLRNHMILALCCFLGYFVKVEYFTLGLLDVVIISPVIADIIKSVTTPGRALLLVFYLFCCTVLIFASFGMTHFHEALHAPVYDVVTEEESQIKCKSTLSCFYLIFYHGLNEGGNLKEGLISPNPGVSYFPRIVFDSMFFVWTGIVLMNIITGLMVDTFSSIREGKQSREDILLNDCFVCGTLRNTYEDFALSTEAPSYDMHLAEDHSLWTYVYYIAYLKKKDPTEDSGIESYVRSQLEHYSLEWIPTRTGFVLEAEGKTGGLQDKGENNVGARASSGNMAGAWTTDDNGDDFTAMGKMDQIISELRLQKDDDAYSTGPTPR